MADIGETVVETQGALLGKKGTILLVSGTIEQAILALELAAGMQAMGMQMNMWHVFYGVNCLRKPRSYFSPSRWNPFRKLKDGPGRNIRTDSGWQKILIMLNREGANNIPLSQLNFMGAGTFVLDRIMNRKGMASLPDLIYAAEELGVKFKICQVCADSMSIDVDSDFIVKAEVSGVSSYVLEVVEGDYSSIL